MLSRIQHRIRTEKMPKCMHLYCLAAGQHQATAKYLLEAHHQECVLDLLDVQKGKVCQQRVPWCKLVQIC
jgi:hypothetical protein